MPTYEYKCAACGHAFELFQSMTAKPEKTCPACGKKTAERQIGRGGAIIFKGAGFYETDYRSADYKKSAEAESKSVHAHSGTCGCGAKPANECPSAAKPVSAPKATPTVSAKPKKPATKPSTKRGG